MRKVIKIKNNEDITEVIEKLWETGAEEIYFIVPQGASLVKNIIALKLLKREADRLGKEVILVTRDEIGREAAKRAGLISRVSLPRFSDENGEEEVLHEVPSKKFESFLQEEVKARRSNALSQEKMMSDIKVRKTLEEVQLTEDSSSHLLEEKKEKTLPDTESALDLEEKSDLALKEEIEKLDEELSKIHLEEKEETALPEIDDFSEEEQEEEKKEETQRQRESDLEREENFPIKKMGKDEKLEAFFNKKFLSGWKFKNKERKKDIIEKTNFSWTGKFIYGLSGLAVVVTLLVLYFILPKAEIIIYPKTESVNEELSVTAGKGVSKVDVTQNKIPAQLIQLEKKETKEFLTSGERQVNEKATGKISIYNEYSSSPQTLVEKTRFVSEEGKVFRTLKTVVVPGAKIQDGKIVPSSVEVEVVADQPGEEYNIGPSRFAIPGFAGTPKYNAFYGKSFSAMTGGASGLRKVITQEDFDNNKEKIWSELKTSLEQELKSQVPEGMKILEGSFFEELVSVESSASVGSPAETFSLTVKGVAKIILFDEDDILTLIKQKIADRLSENKKLVEDQINFIYQNIKVDFARQQITFRVIFNGKIVWLIKQDELKKELAGKKEEAIKEIFDRQTEVSQAKVVFWPFWVSRVPANIDKIKIIIE